MLDASGILAIKDLAQAAQAGEGKLVTVGDVQLSTIPLHDPRTKDPEPAPVVVATLSGFAGYVKANIDKVELASTIIHVVDPGTVRLIAALKGRFQQRFVFAEAVCPNRFAAATGFAFGRWGTPEDLIIAIQILFDDAWDRPQVLALLGNIRDEYVKNATDDGVSQAVSMKAGIVMVGERRVPNPVVLAPFRTFAEIEQPSSPFVFRLRKDDEQAIKAAIFEADGGAWRTSATRAIGDWIRSALDGSVTVID